MLKRFTKYILMPVFIVSLVIGGTTGIAMADEEVDETDSPPVGTMKDLVAEYLGITVEELQSALVEARDVVREMDIEDPQERRDAFQDEVNRVLTEWYDIGELTWEDAIESARESMQGAVAARHREMREQLEMRRTQMRGLLAARKAEMNELLEARRLELHDLLEARRTQMREQLAASKAAMQELHTGWQEEHPGNGNGHN